jgi:hypothetical protein
MIEQKYPWLKVAINQYSDSRFPSCLLIDGEPGLGKHVLASYFAKKLLCLEATKPCNQCNSCVYFEAGSHPDYCFLSSDNSSSSLIARTSAKNDSITSKKIDGIRSLNDFIALSNSVSATRVGIIFDAHLLNISSQNALLKTLEELPDNKFILLVSNKRRNFLPTIYSRSTHLSIQNPSTEDIDAWLLSQGFVDYSSLNFAPDLTPLAIERLIATDYVTHYQDLTMKLNSYCSGNVDTFELLKYYKELDITLEEKIDSLILFLKTNLGILLGFYKTNPMMSALNKNVSNSHDLSELIDDLIEYKVSLNLVPSLNEQIGLSYFIFKLQALCR